MASAALRIARPAAYVIWEPPLGSCAHWHNGIDMVSAYGTPVHAAPGPEFIAAVRTAFPLVNTDRLYVVWCGDCRAMCSARRGRWWSLVDRVC